MDLYPSPMDRDPWVTCAFGALLYLLSDSLGFNQPLGSTRDAGAEWGRGWGWPAMR